MNQKAETIVIRSDILVDGTPGEPLEDVGILIEKDRITRVDTWNKGGPWPQGDDILQIRTRASIPGLINIHVHLIDNDDLRDYLHSGVTAIRDVGTHSGLQFDRSLIQIKKEIDKGERFGPRISSYGSIIDGPRSALPQLTVSVSNKKEAIDEVDRQVAAGVDGIKLYWKLSPQLAKVIIARAKEHNMPVAGHIGMLIGGVEGARMGIDTIEHLISFMRDLFPVFVRATIAPLMRVGALDDVSKGLDRLFEIWRKIDPESKRMIRLAEEFLATGAVFHPTTIALERMTKMGDLAKTDDPLMRKKMASEHFRELCDKIIPKKWNENLSRLGKEGLEGMLRFIGRMYRSGVPIGVGTDDSIPYVFAGESMHEEMAFLVRAGIPPIEVIRMATARNAKTLRREDLGIIASGKTADIVLLDQNPCEDIAAARQIGYVIKGGEIVYAP